MFKNTASQKVIVYAIDSTTGLPKTGDAGNITAYITKDGGSATVSNDANPTELDATNLKGLYAFDTTQAETNCDLFALSSVSATASITLEPVVAYTITASTSPTATQIWAEALEGSTTAKQLMQYISSAMAGKVTGATTLDGTDNLVFRDVNDSADRITVQADKAGNRITITLNSA